MSINEAKLKDPVLVSLVLKSSLIVTGIVQDAVNDDECLDSVIDYGFLPAKHRLHYSPAFLRAFAMLVSIAGRKVASQGEEALTCTAEEIAFSAIYKVASDAFSKKPFFWTRNDRPNKGERRAGALSDFYSLANEDRDFEMLFDGAQDGIEDDDGPVARRLGFVNLGIKNWFDPFRVDVPVDPAVDVLANEWRTELAQRYQGSEARE